MSDVQERGEGRPPRLDTVVEDIYRILEDQTDHEVSEANVEAAGEGLKALLRARLKKREKGSAIRFSSLGKKDRQLWYDHHGSGPNEETMSGQMNLKFLYGDIIELLLVFLAKEAGHSVTHEQFEVEEDGVHGHVDAVVDGVPVDFKSASNSAFRKFASGDFVFDDPFGYVAQLSGYAWKVRQSGGVSGPSADNPAAAFLVANKETAGLCLAPLDEAYVEGNKPGPRIAQLKEIVASDTLPERCYDLVPEGKSGNMKLGVSCSYCRHKHGCWSDANNGKGLRKFWYARGPVWLATVKKEPNVEESA